jgi:hypothetical protein
MRLVRWLNDSGWQVRSDDRHAFSTSGHWMSAAAGRLESCDVILCAITPGWLASDFCRFEFSYGAKRGKFILPVVCEPADLHMLPAAMWALPRVDLTRNRLVDYLILKDTLSQAGSNAASATAATGRREQPFAPALAARGSWWLAPALIAIAIAATWLWTRLP